MLAGAVAGSSGCAGREPAPVFGYTLLDGSQRSSDQLRGRVVVVNFWATSCAVCVKGMPALAARHLGYRDRGLETLAVAMSYDAPASVADFAERRRLPFGVVIDNTGAIARSFGGVRLTPTTFVIDKRGRVAQRLLGEPDAKPMQALLERLLAEA